MKRKLLALVCVVCLNAGAAPVAKETAVATANSAGQDPLLARCELLKRQADRSTCITEVIRASVGQPPAVANPPVAMIPKQSDRGAAEDRAQDVFAAAEAIKSVINAGISYNDYSPYIQRLAIAVDAYRARAKLPEELAAADQLTKALDAFNDAREFWRVDIEFYSRRDSYYGYPNGIPVDMVGLRRIVDKYSIPTQNANWLGLQQGVPRSVALAQIWDVANGRVQAARLSIGEIGAPVITQTSPVQPSLPPTLTLSADELLPAINEMAKATLRGAGCAPVGDPQIVRRSGEQDMISYRCSGSDAWQTVSCSDSTCHAVEGPRFVMKSAVGAQ